MLGERFHWQILVRVALLTAALFTLLWSLLRTDWQVTPLASGMVVLLSVWELIRFSERSNRDFANFLDFIYHHDFSITMPDRGQGDVSDQLAGAYRLLTSEYRRLNSEKAANHQYLESVVEHISVALICLDQQGSVRLMNRQAKILFRAPYLPNLTSFKRIDPALPAVLRNIAGGEQNLVAVRIGEEPMQLAVFATEFRLLDQDYKLVSFQNIHEELEQREIDSWQKLIRVLTHEIMNSVTPIVALTSVVKQIVLPAGDGVPALGAEDEDDLRKSIHAIESRGQGLLSFVRAYSNLTNVPAPRIEVIDVRELLGRVVTMMASPLAQAGVALDVTGDADALTVAADPQQIEQVLINLIKNAIEALAGRPEPHIRLHAERNEREKVQLQVIDNGPGIEPRLIDQIFVPFFTTKREGSGIGLSLSRQIMALNKGSLSVRSEPGRGSEFTLRFK